jgi:hypothetical protein
MFPPETIAGAQLAAQQYNIPVATILGIVEQESGGVVYALVSGRQEPVVRHEGHYLYQRLKGDALDLAVKEGLAAPKAGAIPNPASQQDRWDKLITPAMLINPQAEIESCSWGVGQVMGAHWSKLGFPSAVDFLTQVRSGVSMQIDVMMRYCKEFNLIDELQRGDFVGFTRGYNGSGNVDSYSASIKKKVAAWAVTYPATTKVDGIPVIDKTSAINSKTMLRMGTSGAAVRELQSLLVRAGYAVKVDGDFGPATKEAVVEFQKFKGLEADGIAGPKTLACLSQYKIDPSEAPGVPGPVEALVQTPEGRQGAALAGGSAIVTAAINPALVVLKPLVGHGGYIDYTYTGLTVLGVALVLGGVAWSAIGWHRANTTRGVEGAK